jgi:hypothetical protein
MIAQHADVVFTTDLIARLWDCHYRIEKQREYVISVTWFIFSDLRALRSTEQRWKDHLKNHVARFKMIERRATGDLDDDSGSERGATKIPMNNIK